MTQKRVLVTGGSGFIAGHCIIQLLAQGYSVRTTIRSPGKEAAARAALDDAGMTHGENLSFVAADLLSDEGWPAAVADVDYVLHVASPVQPGHVANEDDLIIPAREGALRVLRAARDVYFNEDSSFSSMAMSSLKSWRSFSDNSKFFN